jgi:hypothetical protein
MSDRSEDEIVPTWPLSADEEVLYELMHGVWLEEGKTERRAPYNCRHEPHYPSHETVTFSIAYPDMTCHHAHLECPIEEPHMMAECGRFRG